MKDIIKTFNQIRDIPYSIPLSLQEEDCCCTGKHKILKKHLENLGYKVRYRVCLFNWDSLNLPKEINQLHHEKFCTHVYLEVLVNENWIDIDITWDKALKDLFYVNQWNLNKNNIIAVPVIKKFSIKKSREIIENETEKEILNDLKINTFFYKVFNKWLNKAREKKIK